MWLQQFQYENYLGIINICLALPRERHNHGVHHICDIVLYGNECACQGSRSGMQGPYVQIWHPLTSYLSLCGPSGSLGDGRAHNKGKSGPWCWGRGVWRTSPAFTWMESQFLYCHRSIKSLGKIFDATLRDTAAVQSIIMQLRTWKSTVDKLGTQSTLDFPLQS